MILGLDANRTRPFMLPSTEHFDPKSMDPRVHYLRRRLYWLAFEMRNGRLLNTAPPYAKFYVAVPDPKAVPESMGNEEEVFRDYLQTRLGWKPETVKDRIRFFKVREPVTYPQDAGEPLGYDKTGRLVVGLGDLVNPAYLETLGSLFRSFPGDFRSWKLGPVDPEGGDLEMVWRPDGSVGLMVGRHRIRLWLVRKYGEAALGRKLSRDRVEEARAAFGAAFFNLPVIIAGEKGLYDPSLVSDDLFHADMVVNILRVGTKVLAFVPTYHDAPVDLLTEQPLSESIRDRAQKEYDLIAKQFKNLDYEIHRIPFADHPVRSPANVGKYRDPRTGKTVILLGKYPYHGVGADGRIPRQVLQAALDTLWARVGFWRDEPTEKRWTDVKNGIEDVWKAMDHCAASPNPIFSAQVRAFAEAGVQVVPVPIFPTGEGGLHCLYLTDLRSPQGLQLWEKEGV